MNERDLEQAAGGAKFDDVQKKWYNLNCHRCANIVASCSPTKITAQMNIAKEKAKRGEGYTCPHKR